MQCRICYEGPNEQKLIQPCDCKGSVSFIHVSCFLKWMETREDKKCEICGKLFLEKKKKKGDPLGPPTLYFDVDMVLADVVHICVLSWCVIWSALKVVLKIN